MEEETKKQEERLVQEEEARKKAEEEELQREKLLDEVLEEVHESELAKEPDALLEQPTSTSPLDERIKQEIKHVKDKLKRIFEEQMASQEAIAVRDCTRQVKGLIDKLSKNGNSSDLTIQATTLVGKIDKLAKDIQLSQQAVALLNMNYTMSIESKQHLESRSKDLQTQLDQLKQAKEQLDGKMKNQPKPTDDSSKSKSYSMKVGGREPNPDNYVLNNPHMAENITKLYQALVKELGTTDFQFQITGGDRYKGKDGKVHSRTNDQVITNAAPKGAHMEENGARAVDIRIKKADASDIIAMDIVEKLVLEYTVFQFDKAALPEHYKDKHYHLQLPNTKEYGGGKSKDTKK